MGEFSLTHLLLVLIIFLFFFGPSKLPQLGESFGKAIRGFKKGLHEIDAESKDVTSVNQQIPTQERQALSQSGQDQSKTGQTENQKTNS